MPSRGSSGCIEDGDYAQIVEGTAPATVLDAATAHAAGCDECRELLATAGKILQDRAVAAGIDTTLLSRDAMTGAGRRGTRDDSRRVIGTTIGRYRVVEELGRGGMGVVYAAHDEQLHRVVALKLLTRQDRSGDGSRRLLREARAMATVKHRNVVTVHDTGVHRDQVFVVMDLIAGGDLRGWLAAARRTWGEVIRVWCAAARGLQAVHDAGLVHRDFKPANVLIEEDGGVQVTDFGLVGVAEHSAEEADRVLGVGDQTETGTIVGTPRYMSPEQLSGLRVEATSDQFSFCVALWEALTGQHPFGEVDPRARAVAIASGQIAQADPTSEVPAAVLTIVRRGLLLDPDDRYPSMAALATALDSIAETRVRRRRLAVGALVLASAVGVGAALGEGGEEPCSPPPRGDFADIWDEGRRAAVRAGMVEHGEPGPQQDRFEGIIDDYTARWSAARLDACQATRVRREVSEAMLDRRISCLESRRLAVGALTKVVSNDSYAPEVTAVELAYGLPALLECNALEGLETIAPKPNDAAVRRQLAEAERLLAEANALREAGNVPAARELLARADEAAEGSDWAPLQAQLLVQHAKLEEGRSLVDATALWRQAVIAAIPAGRLVQYQVGLAGLKLLVDTGNLEEARFAADVLARQAELLGGSGPGDLESVRMYVAMRSGDLETAEREARATLAARKDSEDPTLASGAYSNLASFLAGSGRVEESLPLFDAALSIATERLGDDHRSTLRYRHNRAAARMAAGDYDAALADTSRIIEALRDRSVPLVLASSVSLQGELQELKGQTEQAVSAHRHALELRRAALPEGHSLVSRTMLDLGRAQSSAGLHQAAAETLQSGIELTDAEDPTAVSALVDAYLELVVVLGKLDRKKERAEAATEALAIAERFDDRLGNGGLFAFAIVEADSGRPREAIRYITRAIDAVAAVDTMPRWRATLHIERAWMHANAGDADAGRRDVERGLQILRAANDVDNDPHRRARDWLREHGALAVEEQASAPPPSD
ncbi:MAG: serine/threonine-protein kinase [Myxococcota bacterium]